LICDISILNPEAFLSGPNCLYAHVYTHCTASQFTRTRMSICGYT